MQFAKESKKYYTQQLKGSISNTFSFSSKSFQGAEVLQKSPQRCQTCQLPLALSICFACGTENKISQTEPIKEKYIYRQKLPEEEKMEQTMILCIDLSGSMTVSYPSKYKKVNEQLVCRILGEKNFEFFKKRLTLEKVLANYSFYAMLLDQGESAKSIVEMLKMEQSHKNASENQEKKEEAIKEEPAQQYISRKQIIEIATQNLLTMMKSRHPETEITVVYFNQSIEIPIDNFTDKMCITHLEDHDLNAMIELGVNCATQISKAKSKNIGQNLVMNLTKSHEEGGTALGPALGFCLGLAKAFKTSLNEIVVITDGMSNIGFGQTEEGIDLEETKNFYSKLAVEYAKPLNSIINVMTFEDCCIGYEILDKLVDITGGIPCQIQFSEIGGEKVVTEETFTNISFKMVMSFSEYINQLCFESRTTILCNNKAIKIKVPSELEALVEKKQNNMVVLKTEIKSGNKVSQIEFVAEGNEEDIEGNVQFYVCEEFKRNNKKNIVVCCDKIKVVKGTKEQAEKAQAAIVQKQIKQITKQKQIFEEDLTQYEKLQAKITENANLAQKLDKQLLEKFQQRKQKLEEEYKNFDKLAREKMSMRSRAQKTYKDNKDEFDDGFS